MEDGAAVLNEGANLPPPPRLAPQATAVVVPEREEKQEGKQEEKPPRLQRLPTERLMLEAEHSSSAWTRADALEELSERRSDQALSAFLDRLADSDSEVRRVAADGLAELGNPTALYALERALPLESIEKTRWAIAQAITELRQERRPANAE